MERPLLPISGGLDSSIVAAALHAVGAQAEGLTISTAAPVIHGGGGDNVFCSLRSVAPILDSLAVHGPGRNAMHTALDVCRLTGTGAAAVTRAVLRRLLTGRRRYRWPVDTSFLSGDAIATARPGFDHPWLLPPSDALAGTAAHIANLLAIQNYLEAHFQLPEVATVAPLLSQPLVELCLRIPSWMWVAGGSDRAVARDAFSDLLPAAIIRRRTKGTPDSVVVELVDSNLPLIRSMLSEGMLARNGILDVAAIAAALDRSSQLSGDICSRLLTLCDVEAWARSMRGICSARRC